MQTIYLSAFSDEAAASLDGQIEALHRNNIFYTELRNVDGKNVKDLSLNEAENVFQTLKSEGIKVWSVGSPIGKVDIDINFESYLDEVKHVCELANIFETDKIRMFSFYNAYNEREKVFHYLNRMVETAKEYGVGLYHENEKDIYGDTALRVKEILDNVNNLYFVYDPANFLQVGEKAETTLDLFHERTDYFHIKDVISSTGELVPAGEGDGEIKELLRRISKDMTLTIEPHLAVFDGYTSIDTTEMKNKYHFSSNTEAFDTAVNSLKKLLILEGYKEADGGFVK